MWIAIIQTDDRHVVDTIGPFTTHDQAVQVARTISCNDTFERYCDGYSISVKELTTVEATIQDYENLWKDV